MRITILGHAGVLIESGRDRLLVDPIFADDFASGACCFHPARTIDAHALGRPTALLITHHHLDHWHAPTMTGFDRTTPVLIPPDRYLRRRLAELGFRALVELQPWEVVRLHDLELLPTPSDFELDEVGIVARATGGTYWHMSDCVAHVADGERIRDTWGPAAVVAARYQAPGALAGHLRGLGWSVDDRDQTSEWLEAACAAAPQLVFPYFAGFAFQGEHAWANRYAFPYAPADVSRLLRRRLGGRARVEEVLPGDVIEVAAGRPRLRRGAASWVVPKPSSVEPWEPVDLATLPGVDPDERGSLLSAHQAWLDGTFCAWLAAELRTGGALAPLAAWGVVWQLVVHAGEGERIVHHVDFGAPEPRLCPGADERADFVAHVAGRSLLRVLRGEAGSDLLWLAGAAQVHERILLAGRERIEPPPWRGWPFHLRVPDPFTWCWRSLERRGA